MSQPSRHGSDVQPPSSPQRWEEVCRQFERAWDQGRSPRIEDFLGQAAGDDLADLLRHLVRLDIRCRLRRGLTPRSEDYRPRFAPLDPQWLEDTLREQQRAHSSAPTKSGEESCLDPAQLGPCCPHCLHHISPTTSAAVISCPECGGSFRLEDVGATQTAESLRQLGRFQLLGPVGQGSFGTVWRARDTELGRIVALKVSHASLLSSPQYVERFRREARAAAQLRHSNIVRLYEVVTLEGLPVLVSDFIDGVPLKDLLEVRRLTFQEAARLVAEVAEALHYAHEQGLIHRDVKPGNLMIESAPGPAGSALGKPILVDFGLALRDEAEVVMTVEGQIIGTPAYMSPEQAAGQGHRVDRRSDVYSLGVVLYELLTGEKPFRGSKAMLLHQVLREEPRPPRRLNDRIPRDLETICQKAMAKEPARRYATAAAFAEDVRRFLLREPIHARPVGKVERLWRWCRRNPAVSLLSGAAVFLLLAGTAVSSYFAVQAHYGELRAQQGELRAQQGELRALEQAEQVRQEKLVSERRRYGTAITLAHQGWRAGQLALTHTILDAEEAQDRPGSLRGFEWHYLRRLCCLDLATWRGHQMPIRSLALSPDGRWLASAGRDRVVIVWDMAEGKEAFRLPGHTQPIYAVAFSPDGRRLASATYPDPPDGDVPGEVLVWDFAGQRRDFALSGHRGGVRALAFSPDGRHLALAGGTTGGSPWTAEVRVWDLGTRREAFALSGHERIALSVAYSPDGKRLATAGEDMTVRVWNTAAPKDHPLVLRGHAAPIFCVAFSPDGKRLASCGWDKTVAIWDAATGAKLPPLVGHLGAVQSVSFSPDGQSLASAGMDCIIKVWDTQTWKEKLALRGHTQRIYSVRFSPDGWRLVSAGDDRTVKVWDAAGPRQPWTLEGHHTGVNGVAFSPVGPRLASAGGDRTVKVWDGRLGLPVQTFRGHIQSVTRVAFSSDGQRLASAGDDHAVMLWSLTEGRNLLTLAGHDKPVRAVAFHGDGRRLASAGDDATVRIWDSLTGRELQTLRGHEAAVLAVSFSPDGSSLASAGADGAVRVWDVSSGTLRDTLTDHTGAVAAVAFSPDGRVLASGGQDQVIALRDLSSGAVATLRGHTGQVNGLAFSPDGARLASGGADRTVKVWDTRTGQPLLSLEGHELFGVTGVAFSPDGWQIASAGHDWTVNLWDARERSAEEDEQRHALGLLEFLFRTTRQPAEVLQRLQGDPTISAGVREAARRLAGPYGRALAHRDADELIRSLELQLYIQPDILQAVRTAKLPNEAVRQEAQILAEHYVEDTAGQNKASRRATSRPSQDRAAYQLALHKAETACRLDPAHRPYRTTLGMAHYRLQNYREALQALAPVGPPDDEAVRLAFLAMTQHQQGMIPQARETLGQLREVLRKTQPDRQPEVKALHAEAEALIAGRPTEAAK
jgi:WD40 repeat protein